MEEPFFQWARKHKLGGIWDGSRVSGAFVKPPPLPRLLTHQNSCYIWNVRLVSSFGLPKEMVKLCLTSLTMFLSLSESVSDALV